MPTRLRDLFDYLTGHDVQQVVVGKAAAKAGGGPDVAQPVNDFFAAERRRRIEQQVTGAHTQAAAMDEQVANRHFAAGVRVIHLEARQHVGDLGVPGELAFIDQHREQRGRECLGGRADREQAVFVHLRRLAHATHTITAHATGLPLLRDRDHHAWRFEGFHDPSRIAVQVARWRCVRQRNHQHVAHRYNEQRAQPSNLVHPHHQLLALSSVNTTSRRRPPRCCAVARLTA
jgi:hypothetical protein